jgi:hypothetical protein
MAGRKRNPDKIKKRTVVIFYLAWTLQFHLKGNGSEIFFSNQLK